MSADNLLLRVFLVDDEALALRRLARLLEATGRVVVVGGATDPRSALELLSNEQIDVLFLDIEMPDMNGFEMLARLESEPLVVFTTAYDQYALRAFEVNSIDYLLKPVEREQLDRALGKIERLRSTGARPDLKPVLEQLAASLGRAVSYYPERLPSRLGERVQMVELARVTHFFAKDKLTYASTAERDYVIDQSISDLERRLDPRKFVRIHRSTMVNIEYVHEVHSWFAGGVVVRLKDGKQTELAVARDRARSLKQRLGF
jgi:two-component system LytT family response regulator